MCAEIIKYHRFKQQDLVILNKCAENTPQIAEISEQMFDLRTNQSTQHLMQSHEDMLVQVARLYYEDQLTQADIGRRMNTSRSTVSRMLKECRDLGVVRIQINYPWKRIHPLENQLCQRFELRECRVLESRERPIDQTMKGMGLLAADFLDNFLQDGMTLGVSYGRSIAAVIEQLSPSKHIDLTVVQILGALGLSLIHI